MKTTLTLSKAELSQAVANYVSTKLGKTLKVDVSFTVSPDYAGFDRPSGTHTITANASFDEGVQP